MKTKMSPNAFENWKDLDRKCANCGHRKRLHLWSMSDKPHSND